MTWRCWPSSTATRRPPTGCWPAIDYGYRLEHTAQRIRQDRAEAAEHARIRADLEAAGVTVTDQLPDGAAWLDSLTHDGAGPHPRQPRRLPRPRRDLQVVEPAPARLLLRQPRRARPRQPLATWHGPSAGTASPAPPAPPGTTGPASPTRRRTRAGGWSSPATRPGRPPPRSGTAGSPPACSPARPRPARPRCSWPASCWPCPTRSAAGLSTATAKTLFAQLTGHDQRPVARQPATPPRRDGSRSSCSPRSSPPTSTP